MKNFFKFASIFLILASFVGCKPDVEGEQGEVESNVPEDFELIPAGSFTMGCRVPAHFEADEPTLHMVAIDKDFYMGKYEITIADWKKYMDFYLPDYDYVENFIQENENHPAVGISYFEAYVYCNKRSLSEGLTPCYSIKGSTDPAKWGSVPGHVLLFSSRGMFPPGVDEEEVELWNNVICNWDANGYRLPTEAEWEYAARAGNRIVEYEIYSGTNDVAFLGDCAWYNEHEAKTHEVGKKIPNAFGIYDMSGNVSEMCWDWYPISDDEEIGGGLNPTGPEKGEVKIVRGGDYRSDASECSVTSFKTVHPLNSHLEVGFRLVRLAK